VGVVTEESSSIIDDPSLSFVEATEAAVVKVDTTWCYELQAA